MKKTILISALAGVTAMIFIAGSCQIAQATDAIPYSPPGVVNPVTYTFTATAAGDITAYYAGGTGAFENQLGLLVNGPTDPTAALAAAAALPAPPNYGLNNHTSPFAASSTLGTVNAGDTLTFVLRTRWYNDPSATNYDPKAPPEDWSYIFSDPSLNAEYDTPDYLGSNHNHIYSTLYTGDLPITDPTDPLNPAVLPLGTYVAFEDMRFVSTDYNYNDMSFVFTNVSTTARAVPEPATLLGFGLPMLMIGMGKLRKLRK